jgi:hypothetical protein
LAGPTGRGRKDGPPRLRSLGSFGLSRASRALPTDRVPSGSSSETPSHAAPRGHKTRRSSGSRSSSHGVHRSPLHQPCFAGHSRSSRSSTFGPEPPRSRLVPSLPFLPASTVSSACGLPSRVDRARRGFVAPRSRSWGSPRFRHALGPKTRQRLSLWRHTLRSVSLPGSAQVVTAVARVHRPACPLAVGPGPSRPPCRHRRCAPIRSLDLRAFSTGESVVAHGVAAAFHSMLPWASFRYGRRGTAGSGKADRLLQWRAPPKRRGQMEQPVSMVTSKNVSEDTLPR